MIEELVFYDLSGRRRINFAILNSAFQSLLLLAVAALAILTVETLAQKELQFEVERPQMHASNDTIAGLLQSARTSLAHDLSDAGWILPGVSAKAASNLAQRRQLGLRPFLLRTHQTANITRVAAWRPFCHVNPCATC